ncbi:MAG TPA: hypothetical protein VKP65_01750 [Rhodothermales bacterium]|nr:hypothetical protein [Rhodothermales bacterium]
MLLFDYGVLKSGVAFRMNVTIRPASIYWRELREGGRAETDLAQSVKLDEHRLLMSWMEESGHYVVMYADFLHGETTFCGLMNVGNEKQNRYYTGTMEEGE